MHFLCSLACTILDSFLLLLVGWGFFVLYFKRLKKYYLALHSSLAGNSGRLTLLTLQQPQKLRYPFLTVRAGIFVCPNKGMAANARDL